MASILDGKKLSLEIKESLKNEVQHHRYPKGGIPFSSKRKPGLCIIQVGNNNASDIYIRHKTKMCEEIGCTYEICKFPENVDECLIISAIENANENNYIDGIMVQLPLPERFNGDDVFYNKDYILGTIEPKKDVDGMGTYSIGNLALGNPSMRSATPYGIMKLLGHYSIPVKGKHVVIVGVSNIVGRPLSLEMLFAGATTTICHCFTENLQSHVEMADILVSVTGNRNIINSEWIKEGAVVVDVGINKDENGKICGDIDFETAKLRASYITPVPGGVGPMTVISLMGNLIQIYKENVNLD